MFDVTAPETYDNVVGWKNNVDDENKGNPIPCILLANKVCLIKNSKFDIFFKKIFYLLV
jgi:hypothetical protein